MVEEKSKKIGFYVNRELEKILSKAVERDPYNNSKSGFIRSALREHIQNHYPEITEEGQIATS